MIQHPLPQNVTTYQFRLIGDMTIKQFIFLSIGVGGAIFFYYTNLFSLLKWPLVMVSAMSGFAIAFLPLEERPLDQWLVNYFRAIYRPTRFIWRKSPATPAYFAFTSNGSILPTDAQELTRIAALRKQQGLRSFLITLPQEEANIDSQEHTAISSIMGMFTAPVNPVDLNKPIASTINIAPDLTHQASVPLPETPPPPPQKNHTPINNASGVINLEAIRVEKAEPVVSSLSDGNNIQNNVDSQPLSSTLTVENIATPAVAATTDVNLPFPSTPTTPNTIVGMVLGSKNQIIDNAIIEVIDEAGLPVRATKTNQLGQFFSTTPLKRGTYRITVEKPGLTFDTIELTLTGQIVEPLRIQAKSASPGTNH